MTATGGPRVRRRALWAAGGGAIVAGLECSPAFAQKTRLVGIVTVNAEGAIELHRLLRARLRELGFEEGRDVVYAMHHADNDARRLPAQLADMAALRPSVLVASGAVTVRLARTLMPETATVAFAGDLVAMGMAKSFARPGGNVTGVSFIGDELNTKRLEILAELLPPRARVMMLADPVNGTVLPDLAAAAANLGISIFAVVAADLDQVEKAMRGARAAGADAVNVLASPVLNGHRRRIIALAEEQRLPTIYQWPESVADGGLIAYGPSLRAMYRQLGTMVARILRGQAPSEIPIEQPTHFELAINLRAATAIGIAIPSGLIARADEVIE